MIVDFHTHTFPERIAAAAVGKLQQASRTRAFSTGTLEGLRASMARAGIDRSVVLPVATNPAKVQSMNDLSAAMAGEADAIYFGCIHPAMDDAPAELTRIAAMGLKGVKIHPLYQDADITDLRYLRILERAGEEGLVVAMHAGDDIGFPGMVRCSPDMTARALKAVGPVKLVCAHMGGWRNWDHVADCLAGTSAMLDTSFSLGRIEPIDADAYPPEQLPLMDAEAFCALVRAFGSKRVLFGTDSPWTDQAQSLALLRSLPLTETEKNDILGGNACELLGI